MSSTTSNRDATLMAFVTKPNALYDEIARSHPSLLTGRVYCTRCSQFRAVNTANALRHGWPKCCGSTMSIDSPTGRNAAVKEST